MLFMDSFILFRIVSLYRLWFEDCCENNYYAGYNTNDVQGQNGGLDLYNGSTEGDADLGAVA